MTLQNTNPESIIGIIVSCHYFGISNLYCHTGCCSNRRMSGKCKFRITLFCPFSCCINIQLTISKHVYTFGSTFIISHIRKCTLQIICNRLHHLISITRTFSILILYVKTVIKEKGHLIIRCFLTWHICRINCAHPIQ